MKLSGWIMRVSLIAMIALSLVFTWLIWQNPSRLGKQETTSVAVRKTDPNVARQESSVFAPTTVYYQAAGQKQLLFETDTMVADQVRSAMKDWRLNGISGSEKLSSKAYSKLLTENDRLTLLYPASTTYRQFDQHFFGRKATQKNPNFTFNRLIFSTQAGAHGVTFVNDKKRTLRRGQLDHVDLGKLMTVINDAEPDSYKMVEHRLNGEEIAYFNQPVAVRPYVFLLDQQNANHYVSLLMPTQQAANVDARELGDETVYTVGTDYRLTISTTTGVLQFENALAKTKSTSFNGALQRSYAALGGLSLQGLSTLRYFDYDASSQQVTYRSYAQGLPIFNRNTDGTVEVATTTSGLQMTFSSNNLTVPIPTNQAPVKLPSSQEVLAKLKKAGYAQSGIQDLTLGYYWAPQKNNSQVVELDPTYFVKINNEYRRYTEWVSPSANENSENFTGQPTVQ